jgi:quercetin dioxygenase-like cupin family protein
MEKMETDEIFKKYESYITFKSDHYGKSTLFQNEQLLVGLNCLEPGQGMEKHDHEIQSRFYIVLEGSGRVGVGDTQKDTSQGMVIWVPPGHAHWIKNTGSGSMVLLVGITPSKCD